MTKTKEKIKLKPVGDRVLVKRLEPEDTVKGGIIIPDTAKKKQESAEVVAVGPGKKDKRGNLEPMPVAVGDIVMMDKYSGQEITVDDEEFIIVRADDIIAIIEA